MAAKRCKDCDGGKRPAPHPGPRCATHWRAERKRREAAHHAAMINKTYGLTAAEYDELKAFQGGVCAICRRATGATRRLSVDHDHASGAVRGLLCRPCNTMLGHARDNIDFFYRAIDYLNYSPMEGLLYARNDQ